MPFHVTFLLFRARHRTVEVRGDQYVLGENSIMHGRARGPTDDISKHTTAGVAAVAEWRNFWHILQQLLATRTTADSSKCSTSAVGKLCRTRITLSNILQPFYVHIDEEKKLHFL